MNKQLGFVAVLGVLAGGIFLLLFGTRHSSTELRAPVTQETRFAVSSGASPTATISTKQISPALVSSLNPTNPLSPTRNVTEPGSSVAVIPALNPTPLEFTNLPPAVVMENMRTIFRAYQSMFRANPVGTNPEITQALDGGNRTQAHFVSEEDGLRINGRGELIDPWGTPFFFHQLSGTQMEIHSAGPDRVMWTADDLVTK